MTDIEKKVLEEIEVRFVGIGATKQLIHEVAIETLKLTEKLTREVYEKKISEITGVVCKEHADQKWYCQECKTHIEQQVAKEIFKEMENLWECQQCNQPLEKCLDEHGEDVIWMGFDRENPYSELKSKFLKEKVKSE